MGSLPESQITKNKLKSKKQKKHSKNIGKHKTSNRIDKVKDSSSMIPKIKISHKKKDINHTKSISAPDQITTKANEDNTDEDNTEQASCPVLPKKVSKIYFDAYSKLPRQQEVYENEENKQPKDLPTMKLLEAVHGISSHYANENNPRIEGLLDTPALLCLGILVEEYTKHCTTDFMEKFHLTSNQV